MQDEKPNAESAYTTMMIIWFALVMSQTMFPVMLYFIKPELFRFDLIRPLLGEYPVEIGSIAVVSLTNLVVSFTLRKRFTGQAIATGNVALVQSAMIIGCALCEVVSLFAILVAFVFDYPYFFVFSILGIACTLLHFPRRDDVHAAGLKKSI